MTRVRVLIFEGEAERLLAVKAQEWVQEGRTQSVLGMEVRSIEVDPLSALGRRMFNLADYGNEEGSRDEAVDSAL